MQDLTSETLVSLVSSGEGQTVEFKDERIKPADLAETLVAFANTNGGTVLIGVADDGTTIGLSDPKQATDNALIAASRECCDPPVLLAGVDKIGVSPRKIVLAILVPAARSTVHSVQGRFLKRQGSRNVALTATATRQLFASRDGLGSLTGLSANRRGRADSSHAHIYEILRYDVTLTLLDPDGKQAILERRERVRFLQNNVVALFDHAWGEGQLFVGYRVTPGRVADRFRVGSRYNTLISLRDTKHRGDTLTYQMRRRIIDGFQNKEEWFEAEVDHPTHRLKVSIIFPKERPCREISVVQTGTNQRIPIPKRSVQQRRDGRQVFTWSMSKPPLGERFAIQWIW